MMRIGVVGTRGFVDNRVVEMFRAAWTIGRAAIVTVASVERLTRKAGYRIANSFDQPSLETAFAGCYIIIHSILGSVDLIRSSITLAYKAAQKAGLRRTIHLSSMIVHTFALAPSTTEATPLIEKQPSPIQTAQIYAERKLLQLRQSGPAEVILRLGIVFESLPHWITELANQLIHSITYFINQDKGICNTVCVDTLSHSMGLA